mmetsp:Transcript_45696/g.146670  ORF Transcript_45696/g.146670 Transcript_45696/m.146670 type:complete len:212 (-) Transcript_45696:1770-2405(-)
MEPTFVLRLRLTIRVGRKVNEEMAASGRLARTEALLLRLPDGSAPTCQLPTRAPVVARRASVCLVQAAVCLTGVDSLHINIAFAAVVDWLHTVGMQLRIALRKFGAPTVAAFTGAAPPSVHWHREHLRLRGAGRRHIWDTAAVGLHRHLPKGAGRLGAPRRQTSAHLRIPSVELQHPWGIDGGATVAVVCEASIQRNVLTEGLVHEGVVAT